MGITTTSRIVGAGLALALVSGLGWAKQSSSAAAPASLAEPAPVGGPATMRRLTESQYRATIADVFAPDIAVAGRFERGLRQHGLIAAGTSVGGMSAFGFEQYDVSARSIAAEVTGERRRAQFVPCRSRAEDAFDAACAARFVDVYGLKLFRRPLTESERRNFVGVARTAQARLGGFHRGLEYALVGMLQSPHFLLRMERVVPDGRGGMRLDSWSKATRLSYFLTNSTPDAELLRAAGAGELDTDAGLATQADRLIASPKLAGAVRAFFWDLLQFDGFNDLFKDPAIYPAYNSEVARDAQEQTLRTIVWHLVGQRGDYRDIFTTRHTFLTRPLGIVYRMPVSTRNGWEKGEYTEESHRSGILTDVSMLALHSHPGRSSVTLRGKSLREVFLCQKVPDPPANVNFTAVNETGRPGSTARMRLDEHNDNPVCAACHQLTDPMGYPLESFDGAGAFRAKENGVELDLSGSLDGRDFSGAPGLGKALHDNPAVAACLANRLYSSAVGRGVGSMEEPFLRYLGTVFSSAGYRVPDLMRAIALSRTFYAVSVPVPTSEKGATAKNRTASPPKGDRS